MSLTVTSLARSCNLARSTVLYYESIGLVKRPRRSAGNYRVYSEKDLERLRQICTYRDAGLTLADIRSILDAPGSDAAAVLRRRLTELSAGIERLREHQRTIARLLKTTDQFRRLPVVTKEKFTAVLRASGFSEDGHAPPAHRIRKPTLPTSTRSSWNSCTSPRKRSARSANGAARRASRPPQSAKAKPHAPSSISSHTNRMPIFSRIRVEALCAGEVWAVTRLTSWRVVARSRVNRAIAVPMPRPSKPGKVK